VTHALWVDPCVSAYGYGAQGRAGGWPGLRQVVHIRTTREPLAEGLETIVEDHYYLTSLSPQKPTAQPQALLRLARRHWEIENCLHHTKDRSFAEDADRTKLGASNQARLRSLAVGLQSALPGQSAPQKQILVAAKPHLALRLLRQKHLPKKN
jgi:hypothetical protein